MGKLNLIHSKAPIAKVLLSLTSINDTDLKILMEIASLSDDSQLYTLPNNDNHPLINVFNQSSAQEQQENRLCAINYLGDIISTCDDDKTVNALSLFTLELLKKTPSQSEALLKAFGNDAVVRMAMVNPDMAKLVFKFIVPALNLNRKKWLYFSLNLEQAIQQISINGTLYKAPTIEDTDHTFVGQLFMLYFHWPKLRTEFKTICEDALEKQTLETQTELNHIIENEVEQNFSAFVHSLCATQPARAISIQQALAHFTPEQLGWLTLNLYAVVMQPYGDIPADSPLKSALSHLIKVYSKQTLVISLNKKNTPEVNQAIFGTIAHHYDDLIKELSYNARRWLFLSLLIDDNDYADWFGDDITEPTGNELVLCQHICQFAFNCPSITQLFHKRLVCGLAKDEGAELFMRVSNFIQGSAQLLDDQTRLWQYLSLVTHSEPQFFSMMGTGAHEKNLGNVIYRLSISSVSALYQRMVNYSDYARKLVYNALLKNYLASPGFEKSLNLLPYYLSHSIHTQVKLLDVNSLCWLYFSLLTNRRSSNAVQLDKKFTINLPQDRQWLHVEQLLTLVDHSPHATKLILKEIENLAPSANIIQLKNFGLLFLQTKLSKLSIEAKKWLFYAVKTLTIQPTFQASDVPLALPQADQHDLAMICYLLRNNVELIPQAKEFLIDKLPALASITPENDQLTFFAFKHCAPGEFIYHESFSEEHALQLIPMLMEPTAKATKSWLIDALTSGHIDSRLLLQALPENMSPELEHELRLVPNILVLALKWPRVRKHILEVCGTTNFDCKPLSFLVLDKLNFSEKTMTALALSLKGQLGQLTHFSAVDTNLTDESLSVLSDILIGKAPLKMLQIHNNPELTPTALIDLITQSNVRLRPEQQGFLDTTLYNCLWDADILSWLYAKFAFSITSPLGVYMQLEAQFYVSEASNDKFILAQALYNNCLTNPRAYENISNLIRNSVTPSFKNNQLVYAAVHSQNPDVIFATCVHLLETLKNPNVQMWFKNTLLTGKIELSPHSGLTQQEIELAGQLGCLLLVTTPSQRFALGQMLNLSLHENSYTPIKELTIKEQPFCPLMQSALIHAIEHHPDTLNAITLVDAQLDDYEISSLCHALQTKKQIKHVDISNNPFEQDGVDSLVSLLTHNHHIKEFAINNSHCGLEGITRIAKHLSQTQLQTFSAHHEEPHASPLRDAGARVIANALSAENCPLVHVDLSCNKIDSLGSKYLFDAIVKNPHSKLKSLKLNYNILGEQALKELNKLLDAKKSLTQIEIDGHSASPATLELLEQTIRTHSAIIHFEALPNYVMDYSIFDDAASRKAVQAREVLANIQSSIKQHVKDNHLVKRFRKMHLSDADDMEVDYSFRHSTSVPNLSELMNETKPLRFSSDAILKKPKNARTDKPALISRDTRLTFA